MKFLFLALILSGSLFASPYFYAFENLRAEEKWPEIVSLGEKHLQEGAPALETMQIHAHLASSYFYLGNYIQAESHARACYEAGCREGERPFQARGLYLLSACARARKEFEAARAIARLALPLCDETELKAKVFFNLGAAIADDPECKDLSQAEEAYASALDLFQCENDIQRCKIRLGKVLFLTGKKEEAGQIVDSILPEIGQERVLMHALYLKAQIENRSGEAIRALGIAEKLGAEKDAERIRAFLESL